MEDNLDRKLLKRAINYLLDGFTLEIGNVKLHYYRYKDVIHNDDWEQEVLDNGIFQAFNSCDRSGIYVTWMKVTELDGVDHFFKNLNQAEKEDLLFTMCANMALSKSKRK